MVKPSSYGAFQVLTAWLVAILVEVGLHAALPAGLLRTQRLDVASSVSALAAEVLLLGVAATVILGSVAVLEARRRRPPTVWLMSVSVMF
jgi:hypothetical protein